MKMILKEIAIVAGLIAGILFFIFLVFLSLAMLYGVLYLAVEQIKMLSDAIKEEIKTERKKK